MGQPRPTDWLPRILWIDTTVDTPASGRTISKSRVEESEATDEVLAVDSSSARVARALEAWSEVVGELGRYRQYDWRWDGYDAQPFSESVLRRARELSLDIVKRLVTSGTIVDLFTTGPASDGSIDIELRRAGKRLFFTLYPSDQESEIVSSEGGELAHVEPLGAETVERRLQWLVR